MEKWSKAMYYYINYLTNRRPENISVSDENFSFVADLQKLAEIMDRLEKEAPTIPAPFIVQELERLINSPAYKIINKM